MDTRGLLLLAMLALLAYNAGHLIFMIIGSSYGI